MKMPKPFLLMQLLLLQVVLSAQMQWYQNQDGNNPPPNGTIGTMIRSFTPNSFVACYLWRISNDDYTWKISKTHINGTEQKTFFVTGTTAMVDVKLGRNNSVYVLKKNFPIGQNSEYIMYKLDSNLVVKAQKTIVFPNGFNVFNMNAFEMDNSDNVYLAGDGQYPNGPGFSPASFIIKADKNLLVKWNRMDSSQTSYVRLHIDKWGTVLVIADFYTFFPDLHITSINANGQSIANRTIQTDAGRLSLFSVMDDDDNLLLYGGKSIGDTTQAMYLYKLSHYTSNVLYRKTLFKSPGSQLNDLKIDRQGNIYSLVTQYMQSGEQINKISRINSNSGNIQWNYSLHYSHDSCNLAKLVVNETDHFFAIGEKKSHSYFSKGFALRIKKNGHQDGDLAAPDSVSFQRLHWLSDGITDRNNQLITIGGTSDLDTITFQNTYLRAFTMRFGSNNNCNSFAGRGVAESGTETDNEEKAEETFLVSTKLVVYPNPVQEQLTVTNLDKDEYDRILIFNMQGAQIIKQTISEGIARIDVTTLPEGVYLLVLRSTSSFKEKSIKFVVRK